jgi:hypothetical protein
MAENVKQAHQQWLCTAGAKPPFKSLSGWDISDFRDRWDLIEAKLAVS